MAGGRIKGITVEIGGDTVGLDKALKDVNKSSRSLQSELRDVQKLLKFDPGNTTLLAQQQELLGQQVENTEQKLNALKQAEAEVQAQFAKGDIKADQYRAFQRELQATEGYLNDLKKKLDTVDDSNAPERAANEIKQIDKEANKAAGSLKNLGTSLNAAGKGIAGAAAAGAGAFAGLVAGTQDLNMELGRLRYNAFNEGFNVEGVEEDFKRLAAVTGETDSAVETMANLMQTGFDQQQMSEAVDLVNGAYLRFSDTLKTEGIADGIQETFATGKAIGPFAELLERSGVNLDTFNAGLAAATKAGTETNFVLQTMRDIGLAGTADGFREMNSELIAQQEAQLGLQIALSNLSIALMPLATLVTNFATKMAEWATENYTLITSFGSINEAITTLLPQLFGKGLQIISTIVQAIIENLPMILSTGTQILLQIINGIIQMLPSLFAQIQTLIPLITNILIQNLPLIMSAGVNLLMTLIDGIINMLPQLINMALRLIVLIATELLKNLPKIIEAGVKLIFALIDGLINAIPDIIDAIVFEIIPAIVDAFKEFQMSDIGEDIIQGLINGMNAMEGAVWKAIKSIGRGMIDALGSVLKFGSPSKVMVGLGEDTGEGFEIGLDRSIGAIKNVAENIGTTLVDAIAKKTDVNKTVQNVVKNAANTKKSIVDILTSHLGGTEVIHKYFRAIQEDGDWLNDWLTHMPKKVADTARKIGKSLAPMLEGMAVDKTFEKLTKNIANSGKTIIDDLTENLGGSEVVHKYFQAIQEDGDWLNDWLTHMPKNIADMARKFGKSLAPMLEGMKVDRTFEKVTKNIVASGKSMIDKLTETLGGSEVVHKYFRAIQEDGDWLNDWLTHMPKNIADMARKLGKSLAPMLEGMTVDKTFEKMTKNMANSGKTMIDELTEALGGSDSVHKYFQAIQEDGDWLNDWLTHMPKHIANVARQLGNTLAPKLEGTKVDRTNNAVKGGDLTVNINSPKALNAREANLVWNKTMKKMQLQW